MDIQSQEKIVNELKEKIQIKHNAVLEFNELLQENEIRAIEQLVS